MAPNYCVKVGAMIIPIKVPNFNQYDMPLDIGSSALYLGASGYQ